MLPPAEDPIDSADRHPRRLTKSIAISLILGAGVLAMPQEAEAQSVRMGQAGFRFLREVRRPDGQLPNWISRRDCLEDDPARDADPDFQRPTIQMHPTVEGARTGWNLQVWVGPVDCKDNAQRLNPQTARCTQVANVLSPNVPVIQVDISPRAVAAGVNRPNNVFDPTDAAACDQPFQGSVTFFLMLTDGAGDIQGEVAEWKDTGIDLLGPPAPTELRMGIGEEKLIADWTVPIEGDFDDIDGFALFCDEVGGDAVFPGLGGMGGMLGAGGAGNAGGGCSSANLTPGQLPPLGFECGRVGGRQTRRTNTHRLENGVTYAVSVAGVDRVGNSGPLSVLACGTPQPVTSFFEAYREAGGQGGGGFCSWGPPLPNSGWGVAFATVSLLWWRRRRQKA